MNQLLNKDINQESLKNENSKRLLIILLVILLFALAYYFNITQKQVSEIQSPPTIIRVKRPAANSLIKQNNSTIQKNLIDKSQKKPAIKQNSTNEVKIKKIDRKKLAINDKQIRVIKKNYVEPTDKSSIVKQALLASGKTDPFSTLEGKPIPPKPNDNAAVNNIAGTIVPPPSTNTLPIIGNVPNIMPSNFLKLPMPGNIINGSQQQTVMMQGFNNISIKGFMGNKVIISVDGIDELLSINQTFRGFKAVKIDPVNLTAKFKKDGITITKNINELVDYGSENLKFIR